MEILRNSPVKVATSGSTGGVVGGGGAVVAGTVGDVVGVTAGNVVELGTTAVVGGIVVVGIGVDGMNIVVGPTGLMLLGLQATSNRPKIKIVMNITAVFFIVRPP